MSPRAGTPSTDPHDIFVPREGVEASALHRLLGGTGRADLRWLVLTATFVLVAALLVALPFVPAPNRGPALAAAILLPSCVDWGLLLRHRTLLREWRASGTLHSVWLSGEPVEVTIAAAAGGEFAERSRRVLARTGGAALIVGFAQHTPLPSEHSLSLPFVFLLPALYSLLARPGASVHVRSMGFRLLTAPAGDATLWMRGLVHLLIAASAVVLVGGGVWSPLPVLMGYASFAVVILLAQAILQRRARTQLWRDSTSLEARWRRFIGVED